MEAHTYKKIEIIGSSEKGLQDAIEQGINRASHSVRNMKWFELAEVRGHIDQQKIQHWQATIKIGFDVEE